MTQEADLQGLRVVEKFQTDHSKVFAIAKSAAPQTLQVDLRDVGTVLEESRITSSASSPNLLRTKPILSTKCLGGLSGNWVGVKVVVRVYLGQPSLREAKGEHRNKCPRKS